MSPHTTGQQNGVEGARSRDREISWEEVSQHTGKDSMWLVIDGQVYDITRWRLRHPGGAKVISHYAGQDATEAFRAFHDRKVFVRKYMRALHIGRIREQSGNHVSETGSEAERTGSDVSEMKREFEHLRQTAHTKGWFRSNPWFFLLHFIQIISLEVATYTLLYYYGSGWGPWLGAMALIVTMQAQVGWTQHDYGHQSVFNSLRLNNIVGQFLQCFIKGAGADWWKHLHYQHHAKPNTMGKDPDVRLEALFVVGDVMSEKAGKKQRRSLFFNLPFSLQDRYFFFSLPPLLFPTYFQYTIFRHTITRKKWSDLAWLIGYYSKFAIIMTYLLGGVWPMLKFYWTMRILESHWFVWVTQSNHIPMNIDYDKQLPWLQLQLGATCNVTPGTFTDWFTGHLNYQIEHHLFPTMPRHNLHKVAPLVRSLCKKHGVDYQIKPLFTAFADIVRTLKHSGQVWEHYYDAYHVS